MKKVQDFCLLNKKDFERFCNGRKVTILMENKQVNEVKVKRYSYDSCIEAHHDLFTIFKDNKLKQFYSDAKSVLFYIF